MKLHFVCRGNTFRSRILEAYINSRRLNGLNVSSSGIFADKSPDGPVTWYGARILKHYGLIPFMNSNRTQTTKKILQSTDYIVFVDPTSFKHCVSKIKYKPTKYEVWNIRDVIERIPKVQLHKNKNYTKSLTIIKKSEDVFENLVKNADKLIKKLIHSKKSRIY